MEYQDFIAAKKIETHRAGLNIGPEEVNSMLFEFQRDIVLESLSRGRCAVFADTGLGKTFIQLEWARIVRERTGERVLIVAPLAVTSQTKREALKLGIDVAIAREVSDVSDGITVTNYEQLHKFDPAMFGGIVLDESSILKNFTGSRKRYILETFRDTPYKLACTATPSPNDHMELLNHAEFLNVMKSNEALSIWFINDTMNFGTYRLKAHAVNDFWRWVSGWAVSISKPSDYGYDDGAFKLPPLNIIEHVVPVDMESDKGDALFRLPDMNATSYHKERRISAPNRAQRLLEIVTDSDQWLIWCDTDYDAKAAMSVLPGAVEVRGPDSSEKKERAAEMFVSGDIRVLVTKPSIYGFGLNFQNCRNVVFFGVSFSFESFYQSVRRVWRYGQTREVDAHVIIGENESRIVSVVKHKQRIFEDMKNNMNTIMNQFQKRGAKYTDDYEREDVRGELFHLIKGDSVREIKTIESDSIDLSVFSPPFSNLYIYSDSYLDMGNTKNDDEFFRHFEYMLPDLFRITKPGRLCVIHCKDMVDYMNRDGAAGIRDFPGRIIRSMESAGWKYHSRVTIWKDPVIEMQRTKSHGLLHKNFAANAEAVRQGLPDYLVVFRKWTEDMPDKQVQNVREVGDYVGENPPTAYDDLRHYSIQVWQRYASPVWFDVQQTNVLNIQLARESEDEKHICPLQLDVIARCVDLWTNEGDVVFSPFAGIGSEGYESIKRGRRFIGIELKKQYFDVATRNLRNAEHEKLNQTELFV